ncbi:helix-turn-helix domain-containing protein [Streptomyces sp. NPDC056670]|uniref:helix-turn-helix domain-containing protein n=1 Tax=Streptomyces sp. NPDC056670 TaxID=3345904 RepID=UPI00369D8BCD
MSAYQLDVPELQRRLDAKRQRDGLSWRQVAEITDLSSSMFSRLAAGHRPDADALVSLLVWLDLDTDLAIMIKPKETL